MIYLGSRYENAPVQYVLDGRSLTTRPTVMRPLLPAGRPYVTYRWRDGDRVDLLGERFSTSSTEWWRILDINPELIDPLSAVPGQTVVVR